jgi:hypothetical protein
VVRTLLYLDAHATRIELEDARMMFRNDAQAARAIRTLLDRSESPRLRSLWNDDGPTERACAMRSGHALDAWEHNLLQAAFDLWDGTALFSFGQILSGLRDDDLRAVCSLLAAESRGATAVEAWIAERRAPARSHSPRAEGLSAADWEECA